MQGMRLSPMKLPLRMVKYWPLHIKYTQPCALEAWVKALRGSERDIAQAESGCVYTQSGQGSLGAVETKQERIDWWEFEEFDYKCNQFMPFDSFVVPAELEPKPVHSSSG